METKDDRMLDVYIVRRWDVNQESTVAHRYIAVIRFVESPSRCRSTSRLGRFVSIGQTTNETTDQTASND
jgi:hypothetical protein